MESGITQTPKVINRQDVSDQFAFLEGIVNEHNYRLIVNKTMEICGQAIIDATLAVTEQITKKLPAHHNFATHRNAWREAIVKMLANSKDKDAESYWWHELKAFDEAYAYFDPTSSIRSGCGPYKDVEDWIDENGTVWTRPTAWAYAQACKALEKAHRVIERYAQKMSEVPESAPLESRRADERANCWSEVWNLLEELQPGFSRPYKIGQDAVLETIKKLHTDRTDYGNLMGKYFAALDNALCLEELYGGTKADYRRSRVTLGELAAAWTKVHGLREKLTAAIKRGSV